MENRFAIFGRSGCKLQFNDDGSILRKISNSPQYNERLFSQYVKQKTFTWQGKFVTPKVYAFHDTSELHSFDMQYVYGKTFDCFCVESNVRQINIFANDLIEFVKENLDKSIWTNIDFSHLEQKLIDLRRKLDPFCYAYVDFLLKNPIKKLPIGKSHGDITMSNIVFSNVYYLVDFLDNIYETPFNDLIKIRQDTEHKFYLDLIRKKETKIETCLNYIDSQIRSTFSDVIDTMEYVWLTIFSLLRVLPYLKNEQEKTTIMNGLKKYERYITSCR